MFNNIAFDLFIGMIFIFFLYSLLASIMQEIIARAFGLRGRMLQKGIRRMLEDDNKYSAYTLINAGIEIFYSIIRFFNPNYKSNNNFTKAFFNYPSIKYLAESSWNSKPAYLEAGNFSKTITYLLRGEEYDGSIPQMNLIRDALFTEQQFKGIDGIPSNIDNETLKQLQKLFIDSNSDIDRFNNFLQNWFKETMERTSGWYIRQNRIMLLILGFFLAYTFNVDTIALYKLLANDKTARENLVKLAVSSAPKYDSLNKVIKFTKSSNSVDTVKIDSARSNTTNQDTCNVNITMKITDTLYVGVDDSILLAAKQIIEDDLEKAGSIAALGWPNKDSCKICDSLYTELSCCADKDSALAKKLRSEIEKYNKAYNCKGNPYQDKKYRFLGWLLTALAISLGAPFWFDLLNRFIALRNAGKKPDDDKTTENNSDSPGSMPIKRVG